MDYDLRQEVQSKISELEKNHMDYKEYSITNVYWIIVIMLAGFISSYNGYVALGLICVIGMWIKIILGFAQAKVYNRRHEDIINQINALRRKIDYEEGLTDGSKA